MQFIYNLRWLRPTPAMTRPYAADDFHINEQWAGDCRSRASEAEEVPPTLGSNPDKQRPKGPGQEQKRHRDRL